MTTDNLNAPSATADGKSSERIRYLESMLRWGEALWISKKRPIKRTIIAFNDADAVDDTRISCFMLPSLPQLSTDYIELAKMMDPRQPIFAVYLPSDKRKAETALSVHRLADYYATEIDKFQPHGPLAIGGWSAGAIVARATAQRLVEFGRTVPLLIVIDGALPTVDIGPRTGFEKARLAYYRVASLWGSLVDFARDLVRRLRHQPAQHSGLWQAVGSAWQNSAFRLAWERSVASFRARIGGPISGNSAFLKHPAEIVSSISNMPSDHQALAKALYDAIFDYTPADEYTGNVLVYEATSEPARSSERVAKKWAKISAHPEIVPIKGTHMSIVTSPDGIPLAYDLCKRLQNLESVAIRSVDVGAASCDGAELNRRSAA